MTDHYHPSVPSTQPSHNAENPDVAAIRDMTESIARTIQSAQREDSTRAIEQTKLQASVATKFLYLVFGFAAFLVSTGALILFWGDSNIGSQVIMSSIAFLGGIGFGYGLKR